ncbi:hypothetical protein I4I80_19945 [Pseudomonas syringae pv. tomato]|uniref:hypothetical protein n=1 Tax=Pseudomonas syringae TaxID=317 RepID=UPI001A11794B|nr:hypothetical protein [Pseudomonas syringae pv. tomato]MBW8021669.1 hypothetical protein [Pseudomonas syringae pv. tomato]
MKSSPSPLPQGRENFAIDPFGYSLLGPYIWDLECNHAGFPIDHSVMHASERLKNPILWMAQAQAMTQAAHAVLEKEQNFELLPVQIRGVCESQYCAAALMLVGYSLEICLKSMVIIREGIEGFTKLEKKMHHHRLHDLASFIPGLSNRDTAILRGLTHFVTWAGRYPDPGSGKEQQVDDVFNLGEKHRVTARDVFDVAARVMQHTSNIVEASLGGS